MIGGISRKIQAIPRIVSITRREKSLLDHRENNVIDYKSIREVHSLMSDNEIKLIVLWAIISPLAALAFIIWNKYNKLRWLALPLFVISLFHFIGQWGGFFWILNRITAP
ncbi:MAG: hypothetical protein ABH803_03775 [Candidatus Micrarchaeota archaeon]